MPVIDLWMFAQTLPALPFRQEWLVRKEITGAEGSSGASPEGIARLRGRFHRRGRMWLYKTGH